MSSPPRIFLSPPHMSGEEQRFIHEAFASNYIAPLGPQVDAFEKEFAEAVGIPHTLALVNGTAALHLALRCLGIGHWDVVFCPTLTFIGGVSPVIFQGGVPIFIDADRDTWCMDPDLLAEQIEETTRIGIVPKAVITVDLYGQSSDLDRIQAVCDPLGIPVVSDTAEALGATYKGRHAGAGSRAAIFSFNGNKIITTSGGGMLASEDGELIDYARNLSQQARDPVPHYEHPEIGYNYRMSNILAAVGRGQLQVLPDRVAAKREVFRRYVEGLSDLPGIEFMPEATYGVGTRWLTVVLITPGEFGVDREEVRLALERENIESRPVWKPLHLQTAFTGCLVRGGGVSEDFFARGLCLPSGTAMTPDQQDRVVEVVRRCARR